MLFIWAVVQKVENEGMGEFCILGSLLKDWSRAHTSAASELKQVVINPSPPNERLGPGKTLL
jgi:hypothetical protein